MKLTAPVAAQAAISAIVVIAVAIVLPPMWRAPWLAALLVLTAGIYVGGALAIHDGLRWQLLQTLLILGLVASAWLVHPIMLGVAWLLHPAWDLLHPKHIHTGLPGWVMPWCLVFDALIGLAALAAALTGRMPT